MNENSNIVKQRKHPSRIGFPPVSPIFLPKPTDIFAEICYTVGGYSSGQSYIGAVAAMMYEFMTLNDNTGIAHSDAVHEDGKEKVRVWFEQPVDGGFHTAECWLPDYAWTGRQGFTDEQMQYFQKFLENNAHIIISLARNGGFEHASGL